GAGASRGAPLAARPPLGPVAQPHPARPPIPAAGSERGAPPPPPGGAAPPPAHLPPGGGGAGPPRAPPAPPPPPPPPPPPRAPADAVIVFTGGTTDQPRGVRLGHGALGHYLSHLAAVVAGLQAERFLADTPQQVLYALRLGKSVYVTRGRRDRRARDVLRLVR